MKIDPNAPAFPGIAPEDSNGIPCHFPGLTIRQHFAAMAMQGMCARQAFQVVGLREGESQADFLARRDEINQTIANGLGEVAVSYADALIAALNAEVPE